MAARTSSPLLVRVASAVHRTVYRATGGRAGGRMGKGDILLLTTTGRHSGRQRTNPLIYVPDGNDWVVIGSNGGRSDHPAWWLNLQANPHATVEVRKRRSEVVASEVEGADRDRLWAAAVAAFPNYDAYRARTDRTIPVVRLHPAPGPAGGQ
jgi:deazaflavin-dependent oxidoreductase (nitroreductase family)